MPILARVALTLAVSIGACAPTNGAHAPEPGGDYEATSHRRFDDVAHWSRVFDSPKRDEWQKPDALLATIGITLGMRVADVGAGTGYFLPFLSRAVGPQGHVTAVEVEPTLVDHMRQRVATAALANVDVVLSPTSALDLPAKTMDLVLFVDAYHHVDDRRAYLDTVAATLTRSGRVVVVDWKPGELPVGPREEDHKLSAAQVTREMQAAGFRSIPAPDVLPYQYVLVFALVSD